MSPFSSFRSLTLVIPLRVVARAADAHRLNQAFSETPFDGFKFSPITEHQASCDSTSSALQASGFNGQPAAVTLCSLSDCREDASVMCSPEHAAFLQSPGCRLPSTFQLDPHKQSFMYTISSKETPLHSQGDACMHILAGEPCHDPPLLQGPGRVC